MQESSEINNGVEMSALNEKDPVLDFRNKIEKRIEQVNGPIYILPHSGLDRDAINTSAVFRDILHIIYPEKEIDVLTVDDINNKKSARLSDEMQENGIAWNTGDFGEKLARAGLVIMVDNYQTDRAGIEIDQKTKLKRKNALMILDHHGGSHSDKDVYIESKAKACAELIIRMFPDYIDQKMARKLAVAILSDSGKLRYIRQENERTMDAFHFVLAKSGQTREKLLEEFPTFTSNELQPIRDTVQSVDIPGFPGDKVEAFFEPEAGISEDNYDEMTSEVLEDALKIVPEMMIWNELSQKELEENEKKDDFTIFVQPVDKSDPENVFVEIKMRTNEYSFVDEIGILGHKGGNAYAGRMIYRPDFETQERYETAGDEERKMIEKQIQEEGIKYFAELYSQARQRRVIRDEIIKDFNLTKTQAEQFKDIVFGRIKEIVWGEEPEEYDQMNGAEYKNPDTHKGFDFQLGRAYDEFVKKVNQIV